MLAGHDILRGIEIKISSLMGMTVLVLVLAAQAHGSAGRQPLRARPAARPLAARPLLALAHAEAKLAPAGQPQRPWRLWPCGDQLDRKIMGLALPAMLNLAIFPLAGAVDLYWVGRMGDAQVLAGMGAANQVFSTLFWSIAFLPSVTTPRVADAIGRGDRELAARRVCEAVALAVALGAFGFCLVQFFPANLLRVVAPPSSSIFSAAEPYLRYRGLSFVPALVSAVAFSAFRAEMDAVTPLLVTLLSNAINCVLDPILIFNCG